MPILLKNTEVEIATEPNKWYNFYSGDSIFSIYDGNGAHLGSSSTHGERKIFVTTNIVTIKGNPINNSSYSIGLSESDGQNQNQTTQTALEEMLKIIIHTIADANGKEFIRESKTTKYGTPEASTTIVYFDNILDHAVNIPSTDTPVTPVEVLSGVASLQEKVNGLQAQVANYIAMLDDTYNIYWLDKVITQQEVDALEDSFGIDTPEDSSDDLNLRYIRMDRVVFEAQEPDWSINENITHIYHYGGTYGENIFKPSGSGSLAYMVYDQNALDPEMQLPTEWSKLGNMRTLYLRRNGFTVAQINDRVQEIAGIVANGMGQSANAAINIYFNQTSTPANARPTVTPTGWVLSGNTIKNTPLNATIHINA